jgi:hypothetical protein
MYRKFINNGELFFIVTPALSDSKEKVTPF